MRERTRIGLTVLGAGLSLGLLGDALLRATPWGINLLLWVGALVAAVVALARMKRADLGREGRWLLPCALAAAAAFAWRASPALVALDLFLLLVMLALTLLKARGGSVHRAGVTGYALACLVSGLSAVFAPLVLLFGDMGWREVPREGWTRHALSAARGLLIAVPLVVIFGALFMAADAAYEGLVLSLFNFETDVIASHVIIFAFFGWVSAGYLYGAFLGRAKAATGGFGERSALTVLGLGAGASEKITPLESSDAAARGDEIERRKTPESAGMTFRSVTENDATAHDAEAVPPQPASVTEEARAEESSHDESGAMRSDAGATATAKTRGKVSEETRPAGEPEPGGDDASQPSGAQSKGSGASPGVSVDSLRERVSIGIVEVGIVLGLLNALFLSFVLVQFRYFFGGAEVVLTAEGPTYADYARRGFFELVWVAALVLPLLLASHWLLRAERRSHARVFQGLAAGLLAMLFVIMASALGRMRLYQSEYGLTELRFFTTAFMGWLAVVFVWFALTVLRGRRERFACGALVAALAMTGVLHALNPDSYIVRTNAALALRGRAFDAHYASFLSADAVPALIELLPGMNARERKMVAHNLLEDYRDERTDWRSWNLSRERARRAVREREAVLREWAQEASGGAESRAAEPEMSSSLK